MEMIIQNETVILRCMYGSQTRKNRNYLIREARRYTR